MEINLLHFSRIYFYRRSTCFSQFLRPSSGAHNCTYSFRYCQPILLLAATVHKMEVNLLHFSWIYFYRRSTCFSQFLHPSSGAHNCTHSFRYCQPILLLAAAVHKMEVNLLHFSWIYFYRRSTCFSQFLHPSSGAHNCTYSFRYCQPILLLAATVVEMEFHLIHGSS